MQKRFSVYLFFFLLFLSGLSFPQQGDIKIGADLHQAGNYQGNYYDYSDPEAINIKVSVWGYVKSPGRYSVPSYIDIKDLLSYAGGPTSDAFLNEIRLYRILEDSSQILLKFSYDELWNGDRIKNKIRIPDLQAGDLLVVPGEPKLYYRDYFTMVLSVVSTLISLSILILNIVEK